MAHPIIAVITIQETEDTVFVDNLKLLTEHTLYDAVKAILRTRANCSISFDVSDIDAAKEKLRIKEEFAKSKANEFRDKGLFK